MKRIWIALAALLWAVAPVQAQINNPCNTSPVISRGQASGTATITIASPAVITIGGGLFSGIAAIVFTTTDTLPTGIVAGTTYWTIAPATGNSFNIAATIADAVAGTAINTSGSQAGVHTGTATLSPATTVAVNTAALSLPAGTWDIYYSADMVAATTTVTTATDASISATSATRNATPTIAMFRWVPFTGASVTANGTAGPFRVSPTTTTTYYGVFRPTYSVSTLSMIGSTLLARKLCP